MSGKQGEWCRIGLKGRGLEEEWMGRSLGDETLTLTSCHNYMKPLGGNLSVAETTT